MTPTIHVGQRVTFRLCHSDQSTIFNTDHRNEMLSGEVLHGYDGKVVVRVDGWRFAHTVLREHVKPARRAHVFYYKFDAYDGPGWRWCREVDGEIFDRVSMLTRYPSHDAALASALSWLAQVGRRA